MQHYSAEMLEGATLTVRPRARPQTPAVVRDACLVQIYPTGQTMGRRHALAGTSVLIGRGADSAIRIEDPSVSRSHTRIELDDDGHHAVDIGSTNGTYVNNIAVGRGVLRDGDYLSIGNFIYRYLAGGNVEAAYHEEIYRLTIIDALTDIPNKRYFLEYLGRELPRAARHGRPLSLILFDIDHFKSVNDRHGHLCGDYVLRELAARIKPVVRAEELFARYGGEEFAVVLPEGPAGDALVVAERLRQRVAAEPFHFDKQVQPITISLGLVTVTGSEPVPANEFIRKADAKLYEAKSAGRNRVAS